MSAYQSNPERDKRIRDEYEVLRILGRYKGIRPGHEPSDPLECLSPEVDGHAFWLGGGSGSMKYHGKSAARVLYALSGRDLLIEESVTHTCSEPTCGNPDHLAAVFGIPRFARAKRPELFQAWRDPLTHPHPLIARLYTDPDFRRSAFRDVPESRWSWIFSTLDYPEYDLPGVRGPRTMGKETSQPSATPSVPTYAPVPDGPVNPTTTPRPR